MNEKVDMIRVEGVRAGCKFCGYMLFQADVKGNDAECKHCHVFAPLETIGLRHDETAQMPEDGIFPACSGYYTDLLVQPITERYKWQHQRLEEIKNAAINIIHTFGEWDKEIPELFWATTIIVDTGEIFVTAIYKNQQHWTDSFYTKLLHPIMKDRFLGIDKLDSHDIWVLTGYMFENIKRELV